MHSHTQSNALLKESKLAEQLLHIKHRRTNTPKGRKGWDTLWPYSPPHLSAIQCRGERGFNSQILSEEQRVWIPHLSVPTPTFKTPTERWAPLAVKVNEECVYGPTRLQQTEKHFFKNV